MPHTRTAAVHFRKVVKPRLDRFEVSARDSTRNRLQHRKRKLPRHSTFAKALLSGRQQHSNTETEAKTLFAHLHGQLVEYQPRFVEMSLKGASIVFLPLG